MRKEKTKERIVQAAIKVFSEKGYERSYVEDILKEAEVCKGTFYRYFRSKKDLLESACKDFIFNVGGEWYEFISDLEDPIKGLEHHIDFVCTLVYEKKTATTYFELWARGVRSEASHSMRAKLLSKKPQDLPGAGIYRKLRENIAKFYRIAIDGGQIVTDIEPDVLAALLIGAVDGVATQYLLEPDAIDLLQARDLTKKFYIYDLYPE